MARATDIDAVMQGLNALTTGFQYGQQQRDKKAMLEQEALRLKEEKDYQKERDKMADKIREQQWKEQERIWKKEDDQFMANFDMDYMRLESQLEQAKLDAETRKDSAAASAAESQLKLLDAKRKQTQTILEMPDSELKIYHARQWFKENNPNATPEDIKQYESTVISPLAKRVALIADKEQATIEKLRQEAENLKKEKGDKEAQVQSTWDENTGKFVNTIIGSPEQVKKFESEQLSEKLKTKEPSNQSVDTLDRDVREMFDSLPAENKAKIKYNPEWNQAETLYKSDNYIDKRNALSEMKRILEEQGGKPMNAIKRFFQ